ncbi:hypothetical protein E2562_022991 [Oryza meyeriana var. granulata]|uniref:Uncharacterized protein n=1 Tax=Oryza meyeriana var. granulata TaxID=110450 RepID=A0A6G1EYB8_9ORYZ|nr:hypothetical protein E2562_022991 [Oryza meyeriana var. granulata]
MASRGWHGGLRRLAAPWKPFGMAQRVDWREAGPGAATPGKQKPRRLVADLLAKQASGANGLGG